MEAIEAFKSLGIALLLGLFVGMQRERAEPRLAGIRTFALITLLGALSALVAASLGGWIIGAALVGVAAASVVGNLYTLKKSHDEPGITSEVAILAMFAVGAYVVVGPREVAVAAGAAVAILLHAKAFLHGMVGRLGDRDVRAIMQFVLLTCIILPVVPDTTIGPYSVLNPHQVWLMVVLVVGISLAGYIAYKFLGSRNGIVVAGLLGGVISSTATTASWSRRAAQAPASAGGAALVIVIASSVVFIRLMAETWAVAPSFAPKAMGPLLVMLGVSLVLAASMWAMGCRDGDNMPEAQNPTELKSALVFAGIYAVVLVAAAAAKDSLGDRGLFAVAAVSGLTDMDAITISSSRLAGSGAAEASAAWRAIVLASMSNLAFKGAIALGIGGRRLGRWLGPVFGLELLTGAGLLLFWPS